MAANTSLNLVALDFDGFKESLKTFLRSQAIFKDYDFSGSNINILLDVLARNTEVNLFFLNMAISEGFIDSAQLKNSITSHAKELNYVPRSIQSARARIQVDFEATGVTQPYIIQKGESFSSIVKNSSFIFSIPETLTVASTNTSFTFTTDIYEGTYKKDSYIFLSNDTNTHPKYEISNENVDTRSIVISVFEDGNIIGQTYNLATSLLDINSSSKVYFLQISAVTGKYEIFFGDGIIGRKPKNNSIVLIDYRVSQGSRGNGSSTFVHNFNPTGPISELNGSVHVTTISNAYEGKDAEDIESTRFYAPRYFQTQERAVTTTDYEVLLKTKFPEINAVTAFGGELLTPPLFGKVVISVNLDNLENIPDSKKTEYFNFIKNRCPLTIIPIFVNPEYTYVDIYSTVKYNVNITTESMERIRTLVSTAILNYNTEKLNKFNADFRYTELTKIIDESDASIISNITNISLCKKFNPSTSEISNYRLNFTIPLVDSFPGSDTTHPINTQKTLYSSMFSYKAQQCWFEDDGVGNVRIVTKENDTYKKIINIGTINYSTGMVVINNFLPDDYDGNYLIVYVKPKQNDISIKQNTILSINPDNIVLIIEQLSLI